MLTIKTIPTRHIRRRQLCVQQLEPRNMLSAIDFLQQSLDMYSISSQPIDAGKAVVPIYTDYYAGGDYFSSIYADKVELDGNSPQVDPEAGGTSCFRMTLNRVGETGWFQFNMEPNGPRNISAFGETPVLHLLARGDRFGQQLKIKVIGKLPGGGSQVTAVRTLSTRWVHYSINLPDGLHPSRIDAIQFVLGDGLNQGNGTVWLDEVRLGVAGFDPLRLPQSYLPAGWVSGNPTPPIGSVQERDLFIYPNRSFLYDGAMVIKAAVAAGRIKSARDGADAIIAGGRGDGSYYNERTAGHILLADGSPRQPLSALQTLGDNAWFALSLIDLYRVTGNLPYLLYARATSDWAENRLKDFGALSGYRGGFGPQAEPYAWRSTEQNIDLAQLNHLLAEQLALMGSPDAHIYAARATHAADFVMAMYDSIEGKFWAGTRTGDVINTESVPLDAQFWSVLTLGQSTEYASAIDWSRPVAWAEDQLRTADSIYTGFTFSTGASAGVWFEGTSHAAVVYAILGEDAKYSELVDSLAVARDAHPNGDGSGLVAASRDGLTDPAFESVAFDARLHVSATAWHYFAQEGLNPLDTVDIVPPVARLVAPAANARVNADVGYIDVEWTDPGSPATGIDRDSIDTHDLRVEFGAVQLLVTGVEEIEGRVFRYYYQGRLSDGPVYVTFVADQVTDLAGNANVRLVERFTFDSTPPSITVDTLITKDSRPPLTGKVDDAEAIIEITVANVTYAAVNNGDGTWTLPDNTIQPALADGVWDVQAATIDQAGNRATDDTVGELIIGDPPLQNPANHLDVNADQRITPLDALLVINYIQAHLGGPPTPIPGIATPPYPDVSGDNRITPLDALLIINWLSRHGVGEAESSGLMQPGNNAGGRVPPAIRSASVVEPGAGRDTASYGVSDGERLGDQERMPAIWNGSICECIWTELGSLFEDDFAEWWRGNRE